MRAVLTLAVVAALVAACGDDGDSAADGGRPSVVVTTSILGDVIREVLGDVADVTVVMPPGADPHEFAASARQAEAMAEADLLVINGAGFEAGLDDVIDAAESAGAPVFTFADHVELRGDDPHFWTDPTLVAQGVDELAARAGELEGIDAAAVGQHADAYVAELQDLDAEITETLAAVPEDRRVLVTNHEVFGYFAERYGFEVVGAVIPSLTTSAEASASDVEELADVMRAEHVPAIFGETSHSTQLAEALADEVGGDVQVVELYSESLGEEGSGADTYAGMMRTDADLIASALA